jgi:hypothetical protein
MSEDIPYNNDYHCDLFDDLAMGELNDSHNETNQSDDCDDSSNQSSDASLNSQVHVFDDKNHVDKSIEMTMNLHQYYHHEDGGCLSWQVLVWYSTNLLVVFHK